MGKFDNSGRFFSHVALIKRVIENPKNKTIHLPAIRRMISSFSESWPSHYVEIKELLFLERLLKEKLNVYDYAG